MPAMRYREALGLALPEEMHADENVFLMGEDIGSFQGAGCLVRVPPTAGDARGLLRAATRDAKPGIFIDPEWPCGQGGEVAGSGEPMRSGEVAVRGEGDDVTIVGISRMALTAEKA